MERSVKTALNCLLLLATTLEYDEAGIIKYYAEFKDTVARLGLTPDLIGYLLDNFCINAPLNCQKGPSRGKLPPVRCFSMAERTKLSPEVCALITHLEQVGMLDLELREMVISHLVHLRAEEINENEVKFITVVLMARRFGIDNNILELVSTSK